MLSSGFIFFCSPLLLLLLLLWYDVKVSKNAIQRPSVDTKATLSIRIERKNLMR